LRYKSTGVFHQIAEHVEGFRCERHSVLTAPEALVSRIKPE